jgi:hypothetical protein
MANLMKSLNEFRQASSVGKSGKNPMFKSQYTTLGDVLTAISGAAEYGLGWQQFFAGRTLVTIVSHIESGENIRSDIELHPESDKPQAFMSCVTYYRRASLMTMFGLNADDDDGNIASATRGAASSNTRPVAGAGGTSSLAPPAPSRPTNQSLKDALTVCASVDEVTGVYKRLFAEKNLSPTEAQLGMLTEAKERLKSNGL